jgi:Ca-activated chloride channel homolog
MNNRMNISASKANWTAVLMRHWAKGQRRGSRRGAITALVAVTIPIMVLLASFAINVSYMQLVRQQLRVTSDSAAKAALINYGATQSQPTACAFGQTVANNNLVAGKTVTIPSSSFAFGNATTNGSGTYVFTQNATPINSVQVTATATAPYFLGAFLPSTSFTNSQTSLTTRISHDIVLVLDRSASMAFDLSNAEFSYPPDVSAGKNALQIYFTPPSTTLSRWAALTTAVNSFVSTLQARNLDVHVGLVTYAETYTFGTYSATEASLDVTLGTSLTQVVSAMNTWGQSPLLGDTNIQAGLILAQGELTSSRARTTADRTIILLTDGVPTSGSTDIASITSADRTNSQIVTHVITFGGEASTGSVQAAMQAAATSGYGMFFNAPTAAQLTTAFTTIADSLPAVLIK